MLATGNNPLDTYRMSIRISADGFSLSIYNTTDGSLLQADHTPVAKDIPLHTLLAEALRRPTLASYHFRQVELVADTPCTCVPLEHFSRENMTALYRLAYPSTHATNNEIHYQILPSLEVVELFCLDSHILDTVHTVYPDANIACHESNLLERIATDKAAVATKHPCLHVVIEDAGMLICSFMAGKLQYATTYRVTSDSDRTYFIVAVWKSLEMDAAKDTLMIHGASPELVKNIARFIKKISLCE